MTQADLPLFQRWLNEPHVARWYHNAPDWIHEIQEQDGEFSWIHHYTAFLGCRPVGFCQYYSCDQSGEDMAGYTALGGSYSIDYLIGEKDYLGKGLGKQIVWALEERIRLHPDAKRIVVQPEQGNLASRGLLAACGFVWDGERDVYLKTL